MIIWYDRWVKDFDYRKQIAKQLGVEDDGEPYRVVRGQEYSSFNGNRYDGKADQMDLLGRYALLEGDEKYQFLLQQAGDHDI